jgi:hypothetical protein
MNEIQVAIEHPSPMAMNAQDLSEVGALLTAAGYTAMEVRAFMAELQQMSANVTVAMLPKILDKIRKINTAQYLEIISRMRALPTMGGYISRERATALITEVMHRTPRQ